MSYLPHLFESGDYPTTINGLDDMAKGKGGAELASILCNRALCYQRMDLSRKALKNYEEALIYDSGCSRAHMGRAKALHALGRIKEARKAWQTVVDNFGPHDDLAVVETAINFIHSPELCNPVAAPTAAPRTPAPVQKTEQPVVQRRQGESEAEKQLLMTNAVDLINQGSVDQAIGILDSVMAGTPADNVGGLIARGTAKAMKRDLEGAIQDFSAAIDVFPNYGDTWKRRGQAKCALDDLDGALKDFEKALELTHDESARADIRSERGAVLNKQKQYYKASKELKEAVRLNSKDSRIWHLLGVAVMCLGDLEESYRAFSKAIELKPQDADHWHSLAMAKKEAAEVQDAEKAFTKAIKLMPSDYDKAKQLYYSYAHMKQGLGQHLKAASLLQKCIDLGGAENIIEASLLRGACHHALGYHTKAVEDYTRAFMTNFNKPELLPVHQCQALAYIQRELAHYAATHLDFRVSEFCLDQDIHPVFKELWSKKMPPTTEQAIECQQKHRMLPKTEEAAGTLVQPDPSQVETLVKKAAELGELVQNRHQGFLPNKRQQLMSGLAAIEFAQTFLDLVDAARQGRLFKSWKGSSLGPKEHDFGWRDAMDIIVKWRQLSEPNDQVLWVDLLTKKEFEAGFGSHTPMFSGQSKCVRYYMNFERAVRLLKTIIAKDEKVYNATGDPIPLDQSRLAALKQSGTVEKLWSAVSEDYWNVVPIESRLEPGQTLEGTRLTVVPCHIQVKIHGINDHYEVSIRTPVTPARWRTYDAELKAAFDRLIAAFLTGEKAEIAKQITAFVFYWYNFMPIARGTAVCGHTAILALFAAADMPITAIIPKDTQVDWEALLQQTPEAFMDSIKWLIQPSLDAEPQELNCSSETGQGPEETSSQSEILGARIRTLPSVKNLLPTLRNRLEALNGPNLPRL